MRAEAAHETGSTDIGGTDIGSSGIGSTDIAGMRFSMVSAWAGSQTVQARSSNETAQIRL
jgi:hypothetical protein